MLTLTPEAIAGLHAAVSDAIRVHGRSVAASEVLRFVPPSLAAQLPIRTLRAASLCRLLVSITYAPVDGRRLSHFLSRRVRHWRLTDEGA